MSADDSMRGTLTTDQSCTPSAEQVAGDGPKEDAMPSKEQASMSIATKTTIKGVGLLSHGSNPISDQLLEQWQNSSQEENITFQNHREEIKNLQSQEQRSSDVELMQHGFGVESQQQQISCSKEHNQLPTDQKDDQQQQPLEQNHMQFSQKSSSSISENNSVSFSEQERMQHPENHQHPKLQRMNSQQTPAADPANNPMVRGSKQVPFGLLLPAIVPHIDKDRAMQLHTLYSKLRGNEITKESFVRLMRNLVGDQMLRQAVSKIQQGQTKVQVARNLQTRPNQFQVDASFPTAENNAKNSREADNQSDSHVGQISSSSMSTGTQETDIPSITLQGLNKQQQQHVHLPQTSFPMYGAAISNYHPHEYSGAAVSGSTVPMKSQTQDSQMRPIPLHQGMVSSQSGGTTQPGNLMSVPKYEMQNPMNEPKRLHSGPVPHLATHSMLQHNPVPWQSSMNKEQKSGAMPSMPYVKQELSDQTQEHQHKSQLPVSVGSSSFSAKQDDQGNVAPSGTNSLSGSLATQLDPMMRTLVPPATASVVAGTNVRTPPKKPSVGQKKPLGTVGTQSPVPSKKQKVTGAFLDQSIEQLNDVTAVSGVNLREEEEQLLSGPKEENRASEATRRVVQDEEERLLLQKNPLQKKLAKIMSNCGIKNIGNDVERCLSLCVEERMHGLISNLIKLSKQRADIERLRHQILVNSDVQRGILMVNQKAKEEWERKQAEEAEKLRKLNEAEGNTGADGGKDKDEGRLKTLKANKEEDDKMRATAANVAARVAVGGDDMLSKWQLMAEQARQKREGGNDTSSSTPLGKDLIRKPISTSGRATRDNQDTESRGPSPAVAAAAVSATSTTLSGGAVRKFGRNQVVWPPAKIARTISVKDLIAALVREPQMSKSTSVDRLYERMHTDSAAE